MSLAEELLADLEEDGFDESDPMVMQEDVAQELADNDLIPKQTGSDIIFETLYVYFIKYFIVYFFVDIKNVKIRNLAKLRDSDRLVDIMKQIDIFQSRQKSAEELLGPVESDPEYLLIVKANNLIVEIDDEICKICKI